MIEHLMDRLPTARTQALQSELLLLDHTVARKFSDLEERRRASTGDFRGWVDRRHALPSKHRPFDSDQGADLERRIKLFDVDGASKGAPSAIKVAGVLLQPRGISC
jgi:hypothetical protein